MIISYLRKMKQSILSVSFFVLLLALLVWSIIGGWFINLIIVYLVIANIGQIIVNKQVNKEIEFLKILFSSNAKK